MMVYAERMRNALIARTADWLARGSWPRVLAFASLLAGCGAAWAFVEGLQKLGLRKLWLQWPAATVACLFAHAVLLWAWAAAHREVESSEILDGAPPQPLAQDPSRPNLGRDQSHGPDLDAGDAEGAWGLLLVGALLLGPILVFFCRVWVAPWRLGELLAVGGKVRHRTSGAPPAEPVAAILWRQLWLLATGLALHYFVLGMAANLACPNAASLPEFLQLIGPKPK